jgi:hypothetical protein
MFNNLPDHQRIHLAKEKTKRVVDNVQFLLALHENNAIVLYSSTLSSQIPTSLAANAFNVFQRGLHHYEIVRLCALWDGVGLEKENISTIIELIDEPRIIDFFAAETEAHWKGIGGALVNPSDDPKLQALVVAELARNDALFGAQQAHKARVGLRKAIEKARIILSSSKLGSIMNLRDKHLAHSLSQTRREQKVGPMTPVKYGDECDVLNETLPIVEALYCWINGVSFSFEDSRQIDRKYAKALWEACKFSIPS